MLIKRDSAMLGDGRNNFQNLRNQEAEICVREQNRKDLQKYRWDDQQDMINLKMRRGRMMHRSELILRVKRLNPNIVVEQQINFDDCLGFYALDQVSGKKKYLSSFSKEWMPEFSYIVLDWQDIPETEVRGWRTVLVRLLKTGGLRWRQVQKEFGDPTSIINALRWFAQTEEFRI